MCLFNVHKIIFQEGGWFFMSFCSAKIYHLWQRTGMQGLIKSTAAIISTRGCIWKRGQWKESGYLFISVLSRSLHRNPGKRNCIFWERLEGWLAHLPLDGLFARDDPGSPTQQPPLVQGTVETCFNAETLWGKQPDKPTGLQRGNRSEEQ